MITAEIVSNLTLERRAGETFPKHSLPLHHRLIWLRDAAIEVKEFAVFCVCFQFPSELLLIILLELFLNDPDHCRYFFVLILSQRRVYLFVSVAARVQINEAF